MDGSLPGGTSLARYSDKLIDAVTGKRRRLSFETCAEQVGQ